MCASNKAWQEVVVQSECGQADRRRGRVVCRWEGYSQTRSMDLRRVTLPTQAKPGGQIVFLMVRRSAPGQPGRWEADPAIARE